ncbi:uncharacterized protein CELE_C53C7.3 [Caenorhabditis elegans]|uniref:Uncharacterized protein n=1 Tax=Caenorhabditis elegans TaxID=6239 RepID=Q9XXU2_CAEEL|nr:Uncharacterized protein CELE_C53C7.3 [Caenorhabditis elegans]CAA15515.2 Uncharacterized protein CELE_C53C7.3 [Caenorhabditis elegans]|eukprot:NP_510165.2 Uncharacterized protein CELE_C53C7.3 [Caenorhabditis elegans]
MEQDENRDMPPVEQRSANPNVNIQSIQQEESGGGRRNHDSARNQEQLLDIENPTEMRSAEQVDVQQEPAPPLERPILNEIIRPVPIRPNNNSSYRQYVPTPPPSLSHMMRSPPINDEPLPHPIALSHQHGNIQFQREDLELNDQYARNRLLDQLVQLLLRPPEVQHVIHQHVFLQPPPPPPPAFFDHHYPHFPPYELNLQDLQEVEVVPEDPV